ncbi:Aldo-ket-red domain-containing protein [Mycena kentingensis (nom. inval.)]|nr:Aldo-ket-red domain-containing protein [Mycena kentingensis (nom. inval.)]
MSTPIIYGTAWKAERTTALVVAAVLNGFRAIDTACQPKHYREDLVGEALEILQTKHGVKREDIFLQTKFTPIGGQTTSKPLPYDPATSITTQITTSFAKSLANLRTTYIDSYILHSPLPTLEATLEAWSALGELQDSGKIRGTIGVSNTYDVAILDALAAVRPVQVVQNRWFERNLWDRDVVQWCKARNVQYQSFWTLSGSPNLLAGPELASLATTSNCTAAQALFKFALSGGVTPLCGTTNESHMQEAVAVPSIELTDPASHLTILASTIWG